RHPQIYRPPDTASVLVLPAWRPGAAGARIVMAENALDQSLAQRPSLAGFLIRAVHAHHQNILFCGMQPLRNHETEGLEISFVKAKVVPVQPDISGIVYPGKHQLDELPLQVRHGRKMAPKPDGLSLISPLQKPVRG